MQLEKKEIFCIIKQIVINICSFADARKTCLKKNYSVCPNCQGYFITTALRKHFRNCTGKKDRKKGILVMSRKLNIEINEKACDVLQQQVFPVLRLDDISAIIRNDEFLISNGNKMCAKYRSPHLHKMIRARLRSLGRFLLEIRKLQNMYVQNIYSSNANAYF
jgi:hypothetical protein